MNMFLARPIGGAYVGAQLRGPTCAMAVALMDADLLAE
jgi:hypothetical protein